MAPTAFNALPDALRDAYTRRRGYGTRSAMHAPDESGRVGHMHTWFKATTAHAVPLNLLTCAGCARATSWMRAAGLCSCQVTADCNVVYARTSREVVRICDRLPAPRRMERLHDAAGRRIQPPVQGSARPCERQVQPGSVVRLEHGPHLGVRRLHAAHSTRRRTRCWHLPLVWDLNSVRLQWMQAWRWRLTRPADWTGTV